MGNGNKPQELEDLFEDEKIDEEEKIEMDEEEKIEMDEADKGPEDSFVNMQNTEIAFRLGDNNGTSNYSPSPKEILDEYQEFN
jgi:hypothetical protein